MSDKSNLVVDCLWVGDCGANGVVGCVVGWLGVVGLHIHACPPYLTGCDYLLVHCLYLTLPMPWVSMSYDGRDARCWVSFPTC